MPYSVELLTTEAECDLLLAHNAEQLRTLRHAAEGHDYQRENSAETAEELTLKLADAESDVTKLTSDVASMADGELKRKRTRELEVATAHRNTLRYQRNSQGAIAVLEREDALEQTNARIGKAETYKAAIEGRKAVIAAQG